MDETLIRFAASLGIGLAYLSNVAFKLGVLAATLAAGAAVLLLWTTEA